MWRNSDFKIYFSVLKIYFKAMVPPYMLVRKPRRIVSGCFSCVVSPVEALLCGSLPRRRVLWRFLCVVSWEGVLLCGALLCGALSYRFPNATQSFRLFFLRRVLCGALSYRFPNATQSFGLFFLRRVLFNEFLRGERVGQARDEVSDQKRMMRISGATRYGVVRMKRNHWAMKYVMRTR